MNDLSDDVRVAEAVLSHFPQATQGDVSLVRGLIHLKGSASLLDALRRHREALGARAYRPDPLKLRSMLETSDPDRQSDGVRMTAERLAVAREATKACAREYAQADSVIESFTPEKLQPLVQEFFAELRTGRLTVDAANRPQPEVGGYQADLFRRKSDTRSYRLMLAAWLIRTGRAA